MLPQRILVILPPLLILLPLSCLLTSYYILPQLSQSVVLPHSLLLPSCENVSSPISGDDLSLWQMLRPLLATLEVLIIDLIIHSHCIVFFLILFPFWRWPTCPTILLMDLSYFWSGDSLQYLIISVCLFFICLDFCGFILSSFWFHCIDKRTFYP